MKDNTTPACFAHQALKNQYRNLLALMLTEHDVKSVSCCSDIERFFDRIEVLPGGHLHVYRAGLSDPMDSLHFDYTCDYARCISYIEDAIYQQRHGINMEHGIIVEFEDNAQ